MSPYDILHFLQTALPTIGITALFVVVVVLLIKRGPDGQAVLVEAALRIFDWLLPQRDAAVKRRLLRAMRRREAVRKEQHRN
jgi:hypothetical protein